MQKTNSATVLLMFVAVLFGLLGVYAFRQMGKPETTQRAAAPPQTTIPMASRDLPIGRVVALSDVALVKMTKEQIKLQGITGMFMSDPQQIIGSTVMTEIKRGETFHTRQFYAEGFRPNVTDRLQPGQRAVTILLDSEDALHGYANAGQRVDIIFRIDRETDGPGGRDRSSRSTSNYYTSSNGATGWENPQYASSTVTLIQGVEILALENNTVQENAQELPLNQTVRVTIAVTPEQAETLRTVEGQGAFSLSLRNPADNEIVEPISAKSLAELLGTRPEPASTERRLEQLEVYRGSSVRRLTFDGSHPLAVRINPAQFQQQADDGEIDVNTTSNRGSLNLTSEPDDVTKQPF